MNVVIQYALYDTRSKLWWTYDFLGNERWGREPRVYSRSSMVGHNLVQCFNDEWNKIFCITNPEPTSRSMDYTKWFWKRKDAIAEWANKAFGGDILATVGGRYRLVEVPIFVPEE